MEQFGDFRREYNVQNDIKSIQVIYCGSVIALCIVDVAQKECKKYDR